MKYLFLFLMGCVLPSLYAQKINSQELDAYFETLAKHDKFMGSMAILHGDSLVYQFATGYADRKAKLKATPAHIYRIGSISKTFTAVLVMKAMEEGKLQLSDTLAKWFPGIKNSGKITLKQLLQHQSGIHNVTDDPTYMFWNTQAQSQEVMVARISTYVPDFAPGKKTAYSNSNFILLGYILEQVYAAPYAVLLQEKIAIPLGLSSTRAGGSINTSGGECRSYSYTDEWKPEGETHMSVPGGAGCVVSTAGDLVRFGKALFAGKLLSPESLNEMKALNNNFGLGLYGMPFNEEPGFGHGGAIDGFVSGWCHLPESDITVAFVSNGINISQREIMNALLEAAKGMSLEIPEFNRYAVSSKELKQYPGLYRSADIPLEIDVRVENGNLVAQGTGQPAFTLHASKKHVFTEDRIGLVLVFRPELNEMELQQGGKSMVFTRDGKQEK